MFGMMGNLLGQGLNFLGSQSFENPSSAANPYLQQIAPELRPYYQPYINAGAAALPQMSQQYGGLLGENPANQFHQLEGYGGQVGNQYSQAAAHPQDVMNQIGQGYQQSPGYNWQLHQALAAGNNAASAGGMSGSPMHQQQNMSVASGLAGQDYNNYLQNALGVYGQGMSGLGNLYGTGLQGQSGLYGAGLQGLTGLGQMGYGAASNYGQNLAQSLAAQAQNAYSGANTQNQNSAGGFGDLASIASSIFSFL